MKLYYTTIDLSALGLPAFRHGSAGFAAATEKGLCRLALNPLPLAEFVDEMEAQYGAKPVEDGQPFAALRGELSDYFEGEPVAFTQKLDLRGTDFQKAVWRELMNIPYGNVRSYKWLAAKVGKPGAARAAGNALGANMIPILVPCHRIIESSGGLGGFGGGIELKKRLLELEGIRAGRGVFS